MQNEEFLGIVLFKQEYKEHDAIVKLFTLEHGKQMFFVRNFNSGSHLLKPALYPFTIAKFIGKINYNGLSFLSEYKSLHLVKKAHGDIIAQAYLSYIVSLVDAVIEDRIVQKDIFLLLFYALKQVENNKDVEVITFIVELKLLYFFGINLNFQSEVFTGSTKGPFDFSFKYNGLISPIHFDKDPYRLNANPNAIYLIQQMISISLNKLGDIKINVKLKQEIRRIIDAIYNEYVSIQIKSKKFIDSLEKWHTNIPEELKLKRQNKELR